MQTTDESLAQLVQSGDSDRYGELMKRYDAKLYGYIRNMVNQPREEIEDLVEEVFIKTYENIQGFGANKKFSSWIFRIAHNLCVDFFKKKKLKKENIGEREEYFDSNEKLIEDLEIEKEKKEMVKVALSNLDLKYREVIVLYFFEDKSYDEIADILHTTTSHVGVLLNRGKEKLKKWIIK